MKKCIVCEANMSEDSIYCANCDAKFESKTGSVISISNGVEKSSSPLLTFEDAKSGIKLQYPSDWNKDVKHDIVIFSPPGERYGGKESSGLWVMDDKMNKNSLEEYAQERIAIGRNQYEGIKFLESSNKATLSGRPAYKLVYLRDPQMASLL